MIDLTKENDINNFDSTQQLRHNNNNDNNNLQDNIKPKSFSNFRNIDNDNNNDNDNESNFYAKNIYGVSLSGQNDKNINIHQYNITLTNEAITNTLSSQNTNEKRLDALQHLRQKMTIELQQQQLQNKYKTIEKQLEEKKIKLLKSQKLNSQNEEQIDMLKKTIKKINIENENVINQYKKLNDNHTNIIDKHSNMVKENTIIQEKLMQSEHINNTLNIKNQQLELELKTEKENNNNLKTQIQEIKGKSLQWMEKNTKLELEKQNINNENKELIKKLKELTFYENYVCKKYYQLYNSISIFKEKNFKRDKEIKFELLDINLTVEFQRIDQINDKGHRYKFDNIEIIDDIKTKIKFWNDNTINSQWNSVIKAIIQNKQLRDSINDNNHYNDISSYTNNGNGINIFAKFQQSDSIQIINNQDKRCHMKVFDDFCSFINCGLGPIISEIDYFQIKTNNIDKNMMINYINLSSHHKNNCIYGLIISPASIKIHLKEIEKEIILNKNQNKYFFFVINSIDDIKFMVLKSKDTNGTDQYAKLLFFSYNDNIISSLNINKHIIENIFK